MQQSTSTEAPAGPRTEAALRILEAAKSLFADMGYEGVSIRDIADRAKVSKANVFHHFTSKASLYEAVLEHATADWDAQLDLLKNGSGSIAERIADFAAEDLQHQLADPHGVYLFLRQLMDNRHTAQRRKTEEVITRGLRSLLDVLEEVQQNRELSQRIDPLTLVLAILGSNFMYFQLRHLLNGLFDPESRVTPEDFSRSLIRLITPSTGAASDSSSPSDHPAS
ncbi:MAG: TetR/AcrR family transcriptional regulator [Ectothiorhodospiraceae bacterium]|nr:TetR/AcrR family transcriptional regulator [Ectothiorhodospiraceae bacterium]MCH8504774.1 TetR/AcrR family transcriptional regulator [Ectothiorhodospiraceae bacterium]